MQSHFNIDVQRQPSEQTLRETHETPEESRLLSTEKPDSNGQVHSTFLSRSPFIIISTLFYIALAAYAWVVTCILSRKPIGVNYYGVRFLDNRYGDVGAQAFHALFVNSEKHFRAARILQSIVSVLTVPLTSAACTRAAVVFLQSERRSGRLTMRQAIALADGAWTDIPLILHLLFGGWKRYGSSLLVVAIFLNALAGASISPLQELFLTTKTIRTPTYPQLISNLIDIPDRLDPLVDSATDTAHVISLTRDRLASTTNSQPQMNLWSQAPDCNLLTQPGRNSPLCVIGGSQYVLGNMTLLEDPFFSQLPAGFSTGLVKQFAPRINSTAHRENITANAFPSNCHQIPDALFIRYANVSNGAMNGQAYAVEVCMPANVTASPWKSQHTRQDFSEVMYLNITLSGWDFSSSLGLANTSYYSKITVNTTAGYFELPNYMNGGVNGPLLVDDPANYCDLSCAPQGFLAGSIYDHNITARATPISGSPSDAAAQLLHTRNPGPLLTIAVTLFGIGSFIDLAQSYQAYFAAADTHNGLDSSISCLNVPFIPLLRTPQDAYFGADGVNPCVEYTDDPSSASASRNVASHLWSFVFTSSDGFAGERIQNAFTSAAFIANEAWMMSHPSTGMLEVTYDYGADTQIPVISTKAIILLSALLGVFLSSLLALAIYGTWYPHWTPSLDSFAMLRIGASLADRFPGPLVIVEDADRCKVLDDTPGWIGDTSGGMGGVGELAVGADTPLLRSRRYHCQELPDSRLMSFVRGCAEKIKFSIVSNWEKREKRGEKRETSCDHQSLRTSDFSLSDAAAIRAKSDSAS
ncbi:hypothetical protein R3P38DRAFT_2522568 [Favolaschia claudopus]|uniref:Uncharacterized protein n=1 Tax=Favolaschia claudopus TaxID=2862362 RepID=A0AAW0BYC9_9AGAR